MNVFNKTYQMWSTLQNPTSDLKKLWVLSVSEWVISEVKMVISGEISYSHCDVSFVEPLPSQVDISEESSKWVSVDSGACDGWCLVLAKPQSHNHKERPYWISANSTHSKYKAFVKGNPVNILDFSHQVPRFFTTSWFHPWLCSSCENVKLILYWQSRCQTQKTKVKCAGRLNVGWQEI